MRLLYLLLFIGGTASAQNPLSIIDSAFVKKVEGLPSREPFDTARPWEKMDQQYLYIISDKDIYDHFGYDISMKFYGFDFAHYHILGRRLCEYNQGRKLCDYVWIWSMRDNQKAFAEIPSTTINGHVDADIPGSRKSFFGDTVITSKKDKNYTNWYTHGGGDCFATFTYHVMADKFYPILLLKENNYWGGCRAAGSWDFTVSFKTQPGKLEYSKNTILVEKRKLADTD